jgi:hypothetical protein
MGSGPFFYPVLKLKLFAKWHCKMGYFLSNSQMGRFESPAQCFGRATLAIKGGLIGRNATKDNII